MVAFKNLGYSVFYDVFYSYEDEGDVLHRGQDCFRTEEERANFIKVLKSNVKKVVYLETREVYC